MKELDLDEVVQTYGKKLFRYAYTLLCNYHAAEDLVQDVFIAAYQKQDHFDGRNLEAWLYKMTYNKSIDLLRRQKIISFETLQESNLTVELDEEGGYSPPILQALQQLSEEDRAILLGRIVESLNYAELSERLGLSETILRKRYERTKKKVATYLQNMEGEVL